MLPTRDASGFLGSVFVCNTSQILAKVLKLASYGPGRIWLLSWLEMLVWVLVPFYFTLPIWSELSTEQLSCRWHTGWNAGSCHSSVPELHPTLTTTASLRPFMHQAGAGCIRASKISQPWGKKWQLELLVKGRPFSSFPVPKAAYKKSGGTFYKGK